MLVKVERIRKQEVTVVSSLDVAETFEKEHYHVLEDIRRIMADISSPDISGLLYSRQYKIGCMLKCA